jgi:hypothetical protein
MMNLYPFSNKSKRKHMKLIIKTSESQSRQLETAEQSLQMKIIQTQILLKINKYYEAQPKLGITFH